MKIWTIENTSGEIVIIENNQIVVMRNLTEEKAKEICESHNKREKTTQETRNNFLKLGIKTEIMEYGFQDINGNLWSDSCVKFYNNRTADILECNPNNKEKLNFLLDNRHRQYVENMEWAKKAKARNEAKNA